jgi:tetratricopeptide (TPR) repeat protein
LLAARLFSQPDPLAGKSQRAREAMEAGRFEDAATLYRELIRAVPGNPGLQMNLGMALHSAGKYDLAIPQFRAVLKQQPGYAPALLFLGLAYQKLGQPAKAIDPLASAWKADPTNQAALLELADAYLATGRAQEAESHFEQLTRMDPRRPKGWQGLGLSFLALARKEFEALERTAPDSAPWFVLLAQSNAEQGKYRTAFYLYKQALEKDSNFPGVHAALAEIYRKTGHADWALTEEQRERERSPQPVTDPHYLAATGYSRMALEAFAQLMQLPQTAEIHELMAEAFRIQGRYHDSSLELEEALRLSPGDRRLEKELARCLWLDRAFDTAKPRLEALLHQEPESAELNFQLGDTLLETRDAERAIPLLEKAEKLAPGWLLPKAALGRAYLRVNKPQQAIEKLRAALPMGEKTLYYQLSQAYQRAGRPEEASESLRQFRQVTASAKADQEERQITAP